MSDSVILGLSLGLFGMITTLLTIMLNGSEARRQATLLHELKTKQDDHHKEIDGKLSRLVDLEKRISFIEGEKQGKSDQIISDKDKIVKYDEPKESTPTTVEGKGIKKDLTQAQEKIVQAKKKLDEI